jgi:hypothetical protein
MCKVVPDTEKNVNLKGLHTLRLTLLKTAMRAAMIMLEMGTVMNKDIKCWESHQSTDFLD